MATDNYLIQLGLPALPSDSIPTELYDDFLTVYRAIQNLLRGVSRYSGIDAPAPATWSGQTFSDTLLQGNITRIYVPASVVIARGQAINLFNDAGTLKTRLAAATGASTMAHGVANSAAAVGELVEINWLRGFIDSIGGMTPGTLYWLSTTPGAVQNSAPVAPGQIQQPVGVAFSAGQMALDISLSYRQL